MNPPMVYELTKPSNQRTIRTTAMVSSMFGTPLRRSTRKDGQLKACSPDARTGCPWPADNALQRYLICMSFDRGHAADAARQHDCPVRRSPRTHEATQLNLALEGLDLDFQGLRKRIFDQGRLHLGGDDGVVDILAGSLLCGRRRASDNGSQRDGQKNCGNVLVDLFHGGTPRG